MHRPGLLNCSVLILFKDNRQILPCLKAWSELSHQLRGYCQIFKESMFYRRTGNVTVALEVTVVFQNEYVWLFKLLKNYFNSVNYLYLHFAIVNVRL